MKETLKQVLKYIAENVTEPIIKFFNFPIARIADRSENMEKAILWPIIGNFSRHSRNSLIQYSILGDCLSNLSQILINTVTPVIHESIVVLQGAQKTPIK